MKDKKVVPFTIFDPNGSTSSIAGKITITPMGVFLSFDYHGEKTAAEGHGQPVMVEFHEGQVKVRVWSDINQEDATHVVSLDKAREVYRKD